MQTLAVVPLSGHRVSLPAGIDHATAHAQLTALLAQAAGSEAAGLFGEPRQSAAGIEYVVPEGRVARFDELDGEGRTALRAEIGRLISLLRRAAEQAAQRDPARSAGWPGLVAGAIEIPSFELVFAREGRPVLAAWGLTPATAPSGLGLLRALDDGRAAERHVAFPIWAAILSLLALMALGGMAAVATPLLVALFDPPEAVCRIAPGDQQAFLQLDTEKKREQELRRSLATLQREAGEKRSACPIPTLRPPPPPPPPVQKAEPVPPVAPPPPPPPPPRAQVEPPKPPPPVPPAPAPRPPPNTQPCNVETQSGGAGITNTRHYLGPQQGRVRLNYNTLQAPDRIVVIYKGRVLAQTRGFVPGIGAFEFDWNPPPNAPAGDYVVNVEVTGTPGVATTIWRYNLGCPAR